MLDTLEKEYFDLVPCKFSVAQQVFHAVQHSHLGRSNFEARGPEIAILHATGAISSPTGLSLLKDSKCECCRHVGHGLGRSTRAMCGTQAHAMMGHSKPGWTLYMAAAFCAITYGLRLAISRFFTYCYLNVRP